MTAILVSMTTYRKHNGQMLSMCKDTNIGSRAPIFCLKFSRKTQETTDVTQNTKGGGGFSGGTGKFIHLYTTVKGNKSMERNNFSNAKLI